MLLAFLSAGVLQDRQNAKQLARALDPLIRAVDGAVGERVGMKVEIEYEGGCVGGWVKLKHPQT